MLDHGLHAGGRGQSAGLVNMVILYLVQEVFAVGSVGFNNPTHFIDPAVQPSRGNESRQLPVNRIETQLLD